MTEKHRRAARDFAASAVMVGLAVVQATRGDIAFALGSTFIAGAFFDLGRATLRR